ncbi:hypothetical protein SAMN04489844_4241 [Nocardioides exalbidus]|uniref:Dolichyl-phosphate-mannose-protein mannosyltransferase n=1 Tax=Nocardioides exalbidus TaxID=402596 RepID=A0A1H5A0J8_9ACTN|nr:hypothetical protein [Nocardioides exalbidus]SED35448.1 hypothetical protein SAMN04489844_4241 [Nocardioides exalbidus]
MRLPSRVALLEWRWTGLALVVMLALLGLAVRVGGDWDWLVAMGDHVRATGSVPDFVPFAAADTSGWHNLPVLSEVLASLLHAVGPRVPVIAHLAAVAVSLVLLAATARSRGASDVAAAGALVVVVVADLASLVLLRAQTYSLVPFALLLALVVRQHRSPDRGIWWAVPLVAVWGNLHGGALLGTCVLGAYLVAGRLRVRPVETVLVGTASLLALCANPQLWRTPSYYLAVFDNAAAERSEGLWARPTLADPLDVVMLAGIAVLLVAFLRRRRPLWEYVAVAGLCASTASASRHGVWLAFLLMVVATAQPAPGTAPAPARAAGVAGVVAGLALVVAVPITVARGDDVLGARPGTVAAVARVADSTPGGVVLAPAPLSESLAVGGVRLWAGNPLDAFSQADQTSLLDFYYGRAGAQAAVEASDVVVVMEGSAQESVVADDTAFTARDCGAPWLCYVRG